jgi:hypothetical protein
MKENTIREFKNIPGIQDPQSNGKEYAARTKS